MHASWPVHATYSDIRARLESQATRLGKHNCLKTRHAYAHQIPVRDLSGAKVVVGSVEKPSCRLLIGYRRIDKVVFKHCRSP